MRKGNGGLIGPLNNPTLTVAAGIWSMDEQQQSLGARQWPGTPAATKPNPPNFAVSCNFTADISGSTMTVSAISSGTLAVGQVVSGVGVSQYTAITAQLTGTTGSTGTYTVSIGQTVSSVAMSSTVSITSVTTSTSSIQIPYVLGYDGGSPVTFVTARVYSGSTLIRLVSGTSSPITATNIPNNTVCSITLTASNAIGTSIVNTGPYVKTPAVPDAPTIGAATASGATSATVAFTAPSNNNGSTITGYTAVSSPGGLTGTGTTSPLTVSGLTTNTAYTFTVYATNAVGNSASSAASNSATPVAPSASGGTVTYVGAYTLRAFTTSDTLTITGGTLTCDVLVVGGGGPGGYNYGAGGGGGGMIYRTGQSLSSGAYSVAIGAGGTNGGGAAQAVNGVQTSLGTIYTALGGGYGAPTSGAGTLYIGGSGGSGGGGYAGLSNQGAALQPSQSGLNAGFGFAGASSNAGACAGGGAGASPVATDDTTKSQGGLGKFATEFSTYGTDTSNSTAPSTGKGYFAAGGGGTLVVQSSGSRGGGGYYNAGVSYAGLSNTGGGGGGGFPLAAGGSGIVIIRYLT